MSPLKDAPRATRRQLRNLARLIVHECTANDVAVSANICRLVLNEVFVEVMQVVHSSWMRMKQGEVSLMDFPKALRTWARGNEVSLKVFFLKISF